MIIYKATNKVNNKSYIGQTRHSLEKRKQAHLRNAKRGVDTHFYRAIRKYGEDNFVWEIICSANNKQTLNELEDFYIAKFNTIKCGYNMVDGGSTNVMDIEHIKTKHDEVMASAKVRKKISNSLKLYRKNNPFTKEHRRKLSEKAKGNHNWGSGDTRSIGCYCLLENGEKKIFHSYRDAWQWWCKQDNPFDTNAECTYQRKIKQSIETGYYTYHYNHNKIKYEYPKWFKQNGGGGVK